MLLLSKVKEQILHLVEHILQAIRHKLNFIFYLLHGGNFNN